MCIYNIYKYLPRSNSDHTSPFKGFWSPKVGPLRRKKHKSFIFLHISTIPLLTKVACFLFVCPCFTARGFVLSLSLLMFFNEVCLAIFDQVVPFFSLVEGNRSIYHKQAIPNITPQVFNGENSHSTSLTQLTLMENLILHLRVILIIVFPCNHTSELTSTRSQVSRPSSSTNVSKTTLH